ncbi:MAG: carboxypeptidase-like regulatory domain-containing protein [bacterium]
MRNSKYLLLLAVLLSGILGVYFIGCEGDTITNAADPQSPDRVIGSIHGSVKDAFTNSGMDSVLVRWVSGGQTHTVYTDSTGIYVTTGELSPGEYVLRFNVNGHAIGRATASIPTLEYLRGLNPDIPSGNIDWSEEHNMFLYPLNANLIGRVYTALPAPPKDTDEPIATEDPPDPVSPVGGVVVELEYCWDIDPAVYIDTTDVTGVYSFTNVPWSHPSYECVTVTTQPFTMGDSSYQSETRSVKLVHNGTATQPNIYASLNCDDPPHILSKNFEEHVPFDYNSLLTVTFSKEMDAATFYLELVPDITTPADTPWTVTQTWTSNNQVLTLTPIMTLMTDTDYELDMWGQSQDGCDLTNPAYDFTIMDGIRLISTNLERAPGLFDSVAIDSVIRLNFDMVPVIGTVYGWLTLYDVTDTIYNPGLDSFAVDFTPTVAGNSVIITPSDSLERNHIYRLKYKVLSNVQGDYVMGNFTFYTEQFDVPPGVVPAFAVNSSAMGGNWPIDWDVTQVKFTWNTVALAAGYGYKIYAKDNYRNSDFIEVVDVASQDHLQYQSGTVDLPSQFDYYVNDGIQTPFTGGTQVTFAIRAYNNAGMGPFSTGITLGDVVAPVFTIDQTYSADNTAGTSVQTVLITMGAQTEYVATSSNPVFTFIEAGGDESWAPVPGDVVWTWNNAYRKDTTGYITLEAGECGAGDSLRVTISDNSGNPYTYTFRLMPYINITNPVSTTTDFEAPSHNVTWTIAQASGATPINWVDYMVTFDGGVTMVDSVGNFGSGTSGNTVLADIYDTLYSPTARVGIMDHTVGNIWWSDVFTHNGIEVTGPDSTYDTLSTIYDLEGTDSTFVPITWNQVGVDIVKIWYREGGGAWQEYDSLAGSAGAYNFWAPDLGYDWDCVVKVAAIDDGEPYDTLDYEFTVVHDYITITAPTSGTEIEGGANYSVVWTYVGDSTQDIIVEYSDDDEATWTTLATTKNDGAWTWPVSSNMPAHPDDGWLRFRDSNDSNTVATTGPFSVSGLTIMEPNGGEEWLVGRSDTIRWDTFNTAGVGDVDLYYSTDGWATENLIAAGEDNDGKYAWSVDAPPSTTVQVRIDGVDHNVSDASNANFTVCGLTLIKPNCGENVAQGAGFTIMWGNVGTLIDSIDMQYDTGGTGWVDIASDTNDGSYAWTVANAPSTKVKVRVKKKGVDTGADVSDCNFTISGIKVTAPNGGETADTGSVYTITWERIGTVSTVAIDYSTNGGSTWSTIPGAGNINPADQSYSWNVLGSTFDSPPYANCKIKIYEVSGYISDESNGVFTIDEP